MNRATDQDLDSPLCNSCKHMKGVYHSNGWREDHTCGMSDQRRAITMKSTGDFAEDFMANFRAFFDAHAGQKACRYYEYEPIPEEDQKILRLFEDDSFILLPFFSEENSRASRHRNKYWQRDWYRTHEVKGHARYILTDLGKWARKQMRVTPDSEGTKP